MLTCQISKITKMASSKQAVIQFLLQDRQIYSGSHKQPTTYAIPESLIQQTKDEIDNELWNDNDEITNFTYYDDGTHLLERRKVLYDWQLKRTVNRYYKVDDLTDDQVTYLKQKFSSVYEMLHIKYLEDTKQEIKNLVMDDLKLFKQAILKIRNKILVKTDWIMMPDVTVDESLKQLYITYRQYLRDIPQQSSWLEEKYILTTFPISPEEYLERYPEQDVEYLSTDNQFNPEVAVRLKAKLLKFAWTLGLHGTSVGIDPEEFEALEASVDNLQDLETRINWMLSKIDPTLEIKVVSGESE